MRFLAIYILLLLCSLSAIAVENYPFTPIDGNNGLSGNQVRNITQLPDGRMMVTTEGLLNIYDGTAFNYLHYTDKNSLPLSKYSGFHHDYVARNGYMWLKNRHKLYIIDINRERFVEDPKAFVQALGMYFPLQDFFMDQEKNLWMIAEEGDLYYFPEGKKPQLFLSKISKFSRDNDYVYDLAVLNKKLYLFYRSGLLICFDLASKKELYRQYSLPLSEAEKYASTSFVMPGKKQFYQLKNGSAGGIMLGYDPQKRQWTTVLKTAYWLNYLSIDKTGNIWVTCKEGMWRLNTASSQKEFIPNLKLVDGQIINTEVSTIYHDKQGGMWLGTLNRGLLYYHPDRFKFRNIGKAFFQLSNAANLSVSCFTENTNGEILVGTKQGLFRYSPRLGTIVKHPATENLDCNALLRDRHNRIWLATNGKGLINIDPNGKLQYYKSSPETVYSILENPDGTLVLGTARTGFGTFYPDGGTYKKNEGSKEIDYSSVLQLSYITTDLLAGVCDDGFFTCSLKSNKIKLYRGSHAYTSLLVDSKKQIWLGSQDGLHLLDLKTGKTRSFYTSDGLVNNYIQSILQTPNGTIWLSTSSGLSRLNQQSDGNFSFSNFNRVDGVIANEFWARAAYISKSGNIYWGGIDGFNELPIQNTITNKETRIPLFVNFMLFNKKVESGIEYDDHIVLKDPLPVTKEITLNYNQNFFSLEFTSLNYINPSQSYYRYQLVGVDKNEQEIQSANGRGHVTYTDLEPGTYHFKVRASDYNNDWAQNYAEIKIQIKAPFWKTPLAYCGYLVLAIGTIVLGIRFYLHRKRRKLVLEQKEKLNQMKAAFLQNINQEIGQPLSQIIAPLDTILKHTDEGRLKVQLKEIHHNAEDLKELVNQLSEEVLTPLASDENALNMDVLILNMRKLLAQQQERKESVPIRENDSSQNETLLSAYDEKLIQRALKYVEENLDDPNYSVELLSKDMGMDRTGLYRKLVNVIGKTPTTFIRSIRLKRAALLLEEGFTVAEVADRVGFSTSSYLTKCFQEEFGMKPSQYIASLKQPKNNQNS